MPLKLNKWFLLCVLAVGLRSFGLSGQSLSIDECLEMQMAESSSGEILRAPNSFPPAYHLLLKGWRSIDGGKIAVRRLSLLFGLLSLPVIWKLAREAFDEETAIIALSIAAVAPFHVYYSQEGRVYSLFLLLSALAMLLGRRLLRDDVRPWDRCAFVLVGAMGGYTHYYFAVLLVAIGIGFLLSKGPVFTLGRLVPLAIAIGVLAGPLFGLLPDDLGFQKELRAPRPASLAAIGYTLFSFESGYTLGPSRSELHTISGGAALRQALPWVASLGLVAGSLFLLGLRRLWKDEARLFWLSVLLVPFGIVIVLCSLLGVTYNTRFVVFCWLPYSLVVAAGITDLNARRKLLVAILLLGFYGVAIYNRHYVPAHQNEDMKSVATFLDHQDAAPVFVCSSYMDIPLREYLRDPTRAIRFVDRSLVGHAEEEGLATLDDQRARFWFVYSREFHGDPEQAVFLHVKQHHQAILKMEAAGVRVFECFPHDD